MHNPAVVLSVLVLAMALGARPAQGDVVSDPQTALSFATGEITAVDHAARELKVRVYLDSDGNYDRHELRLSFDAETMITDGEAGLSAVFLEPDREIDVEYDAEREVATYVFIYL